MNPDILVKPSFALMSRFSKVGWVKGTECCLKRKREGPFDLSFATTQSTVLFRPSLFLLASAPLTLMSEFFVGGGSKHHNHLSAPTINSNGPSREKALGERGQPSTQQLIVSSQKITQKGLPSLPLPPIVTPFLGFGDRAQIYTVSPLG